MRGGLHAATRSRASVEGLYRHTRLAPRTHICALLHVPVGVWSATSEPTLLRTAYGGRVVRCKMYVVWPDLECYGIGRQCVPYTLYIDKEVLGMVERHWIGR